ncbi:MAG: putative selenium-dependent hydroxylase accessory protein YqeC [Sphaerochaetaceae bacterium]|nr:putative selenium-dependent hydroxylase accessory protein YqeC [Sphaerochaetaceae bacterium]
MDLYSYIDSKYLGKDKNIISITGGGGKTTFLIRFASYLKKKGKSVLITTTTKLIRPELIDYKEDKVFYLRDDVLSYRPVNEVVFYAKILNERKCQAIDTADVSSLSALYDVILIEADGAANLPLKLHTEKDPVVAKETTLTVMIMGLGGYNKSIKDVCFGSCEDGIADKNFIQALLDNREGVLKRCTGDGLVIVNQCDSFSYKDLEELKCKYEILFASEVEDKIYASI